MNYMRFSFCIAINSDTVEIGLRLALEHRLGGRDALILASYLSIMQMSTFVTFDQTLLDIKEAKIGGKSLRIAKPGPISQSRTFSLCS
ncbi:MAG TPA: hypothetical protein VJN71_00325 [Nitrososphaerales archaeon]|nr:hypothetical protein [Nitrososphaerales archaeon]